MSPRESFRWIGATRTCWGLISFRETRPISWRVSRVKTSTQGFRARPSLSGWSINRCHPQEGLRRGQGRVRPRIRPAGPILLLRNLIAPSRIAVFPNRSEGFGHGVNSSLQSDQSQEIVWPVAAVERAAGRWVAKSAACGAESGTARNKRGDRLSFVTAMTMPRDDRRPGAAFRPTGAFSSVPRSEVMPPLKSAQSARFRACWLQAC